MSTTLSLTELRQTPVSELRKDLRERRMALAKMRLGLEIQKEKNHALYKKDRKDVARICAVIVELEKKATKTKSPVIAKTPESAVSASQSAKKPVKRTGSRKKTA